MRKVTVTTIDNGWLVVYPNPNGGGNVTEAFTWDGEDDGKEECEAVQSLLWAVKEGLGKYYSKHNKYNVSIKVEETNKD